MNCLFVDVDGVLNDAQTITRVGNWIFVDDDKVERLAEIVSATNASVIISSDWRLLPTETFEGLESENPYPLWSALLNKFEQFNIHITDTTGEYCETRGEEIMEYVQAHPEIDNWIALDDITDLHEAEPHHLWVDQHYGLLDVHVRECISRLRGER